MRVESEGKGGNRGVRQSVGVRESSRALSPFIQSQKQRKRDRRQGNSARNLQRVRVSAR